MTVCSCSIIAVLLIVFYSGMDCIIGDTGLKLFSKQRVVNRAVRTDRHDLRTRCTITPFAFK